MDHLDENDTWTNEYLLVYVYDFPYSSTKVNSKSTLVLIVRLMNYRIAIVVKFI